MTVLPLSAKAEETDFYVTLHGGLNLLREAEMVESESDSLNAGRDVGFHRGFTVGGAFGSVYSFRRDTPWEYRFRPELDLSYRDNNAEEFTFTTADGQSISMSGGGEVSSLSGLANLWVDAPKVGALRPYAGGGIGFSHMQMGNMGVRAEGFEFSFSEESDNVFTWQLGAGVGIELTQEMSLGVDYRWLTSQEPRFSDSLRDDNDSEFSSHSFMGTIRYDF